MDSSGVQGSGVGGGGMAGLIAGIAAVGAGMRVIESGDGRTGGGEPGFEVVDALDQAGERTADRVRHQVVIEVDAVGPGRVAASSRFVSLSISCRP